MGVGCGFYHRAFVIVFALLSVFYTARSILIQLLGKKTLDFNTKTRRDCLRGSISCLRFVVELFDLVVRLAGQVYTELAVDIRVNL